MTQIKRVTLPDGREPLLTIEPWLDAYGSIAGFYFPAHSLVEGVTHGDLTDAIKRGDVRPLQSVILGGRDYRIVSIETGGSKDRVRVELGTICLARYRESTREAFEQMPVWPPDFAYINVPCAPYSVAGR